MTRTFDITVGLNGRQLFDFLESQVGRRVIVTVDSQPIDGDPMKLTCMDCGMPYGGDDWLDCVLPRWQWLEIHPDDGGVLCANCIVKRASKIKGAISVHAVIGIVPEGFGS